MTHSRPACLAPKKDHSSERLSAAGVVGHEPAGATWKPRGMVNTLRPKGMSYRTYDYSAYRAGHTKAGGEKPSKKNEGGKAKQEE